MTGRGPNVFGRGQGRTGRASKASSFWGRAVLCRAGLAGCMGMRRGHWPLTAGLFEACSRWGVQLLGRSPPVSCWVLAHPPKQVPPLQACKAGTCSPGRAESASGPRHTGLLQPCGCRAPWTRLGGLSCEKPVPSLARRISETGRAEYCSLPETAYCHALAILPLA